MRARAFVKAAVPVVVGAVLVAAAVSGTRASRTVELEFAPLLSSPPSVFEALLIVAAVLCLPVILLGMFLRRSRGAEDEDGGRRWLRRLAVLAALVVGVILLQGVLPDADAEHVHGADDPLDAGAGVDVLHWSAWVAVLTIGLAGAAGAALWLRARSARARVDPLATTDPDREAAAIRAAHAALADQSGDPRAAVVRCYAAMEEVLASAGASRRRAESPEELLARAVADGRLPAEPGRRLTDLFLVARFSSAPVTDDDVAAGRAALRGIDPGVRQ